MSFELVLKVGLGHFATICAHWLTDALLPKPSLGRDASMNRDVIGAGRLAGDKMAVRDKND